MAGAPLTESEKVVARVFALLSGTLTTLAGTAIGNLSFLAGEGTKTIGGAAQFTAVMGLAFAALGAIMYWHKQSFAAAEADEEKDGVTGLTPSEARSLAVDEGVNNLTGAMASILAQAWFQLLPGMDTPIGILEVFLGGAATLVLGEWLQRSLAKDSMAEYIVALWNGLNVGSVSWWIGFAASDYTQNCLGAPDGSSSKVAYWMYLVALVIALVLMALFNTLSALLGKSPEEDCKPYGHIVCTMLKGVPMFSSGFILSNVVQNRYDAEFIVGTCVWMVLSTLIVVAFERILKTSKLVPGANLGEGKALYHFSTSAVSLLQQTFAFVVGNLAGSALAMYASSAKDPAWVTLGALFQVLAFMVESARTRCLPAFFKDAAADYKELGCE